MAEENSLPTHLQGDDGEQSPTAKLRATHHAILRLKFEGFKNTDIAGQLGLHPTTVNIVTRGPIFKSELARLQREAEERMLDIPTRVRIAHEINGAGVEAVRLNRQIMNDQNSGLKLRSKIATHFMDRAVFNKDPDAATPASYRDILTHLKEVSTQLKRSVVTPAETIDVTPTDSVQQVNGPREKRVVSDEEVC